MFLQTARNRFLGESPQHALLCNLDHPPPQDRRLRWIAIIVATGFAAAKVGSDFKEDFNLPKSDSQKALTLLEDNYPSQAGDSGQIVFYAKDGLADPAVKAKITTALDKIAKVDGISGVTSPYSPEGAAQISAVGASKGQIGFATVNWSDPISMDKVETQVDPVLKVINEARQSDLDIQAGGNPFVTAQQSDSNASETVGVTAAMVVLFIMFGTFLAMGMPIITALIAVGTSIVADRRALARLQRRPSSPPSCRS